MVVTIASRGGESGSQFKTVTVEIADKCPVCGGDRGEPTKRQFYEDGVCYEVDTWKNPCGHVDSDGDVLLEAQKLAPVLRRMRGRARVVSMLENPDYHGD